MFKIEPNPTFWATVGITMPGESEPGKFEVEFRHKGVTEWDEFRKETAGQPMREVFPRLIAAWRGVDVPYSDDALQRLLDRWPRAALDLYEAYARELFEARVKN